MSAADVANALYTMALYNYILTSSPKNHQHINQLAHFSCDLVPCFPSPLPSSALGSLG